MSNAIFPAATLPRSVEKTTTSVTIIWDTIGGDIYVSHGRIPGTLEDATESDILDALDFDDGGTALGSDIPADVGIIAVFPGHIYSRWGAAINDSEPRG